MWTYVAVCDVDTVAGLLIGKAVRRQESRVGCHRPVVPWDSTHEIMMRLRQKHCPSTSTVTRRGVQTAEGRGKVGDKGKKKGDLLDTFCLSGAC